MTSQVQKQVSFSNMNTNGETSTLDNAGSNMFSKR